MRVCIILLVIATLAISAMGECPPGEYNPGPDCSFEIICTPQHSAHYRPEHYCDCWCNPGTVRDVVTKKCVKECAYHKV
ncbi:uncharacterized protein LOC114359545 [Ostrinia furnacalis]|uniref:uncharacterized protein LOC114359545 n=1 Tax=Ostrinia furnacalis TaxID=93504 RepID=UPI001040DB10|nr:uncharacterized protein LOC114359545 [Ostrinia furnacalis]